MVLQRKFSCNYIHNQGQLCALLSTWGMSLSTGIILAYAFSGNATLILSIALNQEFKSLTALFSLLFPTVACVVALRCSALWLCYLVVVLEGISRGFCSMLIYYGAGSASWLLRIFFLFSATISSVCMWMLLLQHMRDPKHFTWIDVYTALMSICIVLIIDIHVLSPFIADLTKYL